MYNHTHMIRSFLAKLQKSLLAFNNPRSAFLLAFFIYLLISLAGGMPWKHSTCNYFSYLADAFLHGQLNLRLIPAYTGDLVFFNNLYYLYWAPFPAVVMMPFVLLFGVNVSDVLVTIGVGAFNVAMLAALLGALNERGIITLTAVKRAWLVIFFAFGTVHMTLAPNGNVWFTSQTVGIACLFSAYYAAVGMQGWKAYLVAGLSMAAALATRYPLILAGVWPAWYLINRTRKEDAKHLLRNMMIGSLPVIVTGALIGLYNFTRFGSPFDYGYTYHQMNDFFRADYETYGPFNIHYLPTNVYYQYIYYPFPIREDFLMGGSLFLLSPVFFAALWSLWKDRKNLSTWMLFVTINLVNIPILLLMGTGWQQFGPRYTLDFIVPLLLLTAQGSRYFSALVIKVLTAISLIHYFTGILIFIQLFTR